MTDTVTLRGGEYDANALEEALNIIEDDDGNATGTNVVIGDVAVLADNFDGPGVLVTHADNLDLDAGDDPVDGRVERPTPPEAVYDEIGYFRGEIEAARSGGFEDFRAAVLDTIDDRPNCVTSCDTRDTSGDHDLAVSVATSANTRQWSFFEDFGEHIVYINGGEDDSGRPFSTYDGLTRPEWSGSREPVTFFLDYPEDGW